MYIGIEGREEKIRENEIGGNIAAKG